MTVCILLKLAEKLAGKSWFSDTKVQKSVLNCSKAMMLKSTYKTGGKSVLVTKQGIKSTREVIAF